ncbi:hypothetical protein OsI_37885 [Oryza sativa Indica Group]|uniref:Uncharacterized protein n=1 Tax=Oryza sativa subsp. indica TaxID=39946 RepID=B8BNR2_ORYSI|nr:hypothetical protein OsI_37885 [Oryza sativa Indica Group]
MVAGLLDDALGAPESVKAAPEERDGNCGAVEMVEAADGGDGGLIWIDQLGGMLGALQMLRWRQGPGWCWPVMVVVLVVGWLDGTLGATTSTMTATRLRTMMTVMVVTTEVGDVGGGYSVRLCLSFKWCARSASDCHDDLD